MAQAIKTAGTMIKVAITGPESSGKTTLAIGLADHYKVPVIPEFAREYLQELDRDYVQEDLDRIAEGQLRSTCAKVGQQLMISDTEMLVMKVWSEFKYGNCSPYIEQLWDDQQFDLYLLCAPDITYEDDPLRENPEDREELFEIYNSHLEEKGEHFVIISGNHDERLKQAVSAIDDLI
jgi:NadR type nicotinamide-nucleotide adenylyltransferase